MIEKYALLALATLAIFSLMKLFQESLHWLLQRLNQVPAASPAAITRKTEQTAKHSCLI